MLKIKSEFKRKYGKSLYYFIQASFSSLVLDHGPLPSVFIVFMVPLEFVWRCVRGCSDNIVLSV